MSYSANQYNYATPLSSASNLSQDVVTGTQLLDFEAWIANINSVGVSRGTFVADLAQSTISIKASQNDAFTPYEGVIALRIPAKPNTQYTLTCSRSGAEGRAFLFGNGLTTNMVESAASATDIKITLLTGSDVTFITFRVGAQTAGQTATFSRIMICEGAEAKTWERYNNRLAYPTDKKYFALFDNTLDGSYFPIVGDVGLWGTSLSDSGGTLAVPYVLTIEDSLDVRALRIIGSSYCHPVDFTAILYNGDSIVSNISETGNTATTYLHYFGTVVTVTKIVITVTRVSESNAPALLYNVFNPDAMRRSDALLFNLHESKSLGDSASKRSSDAFKLKGTETAPLAVHVAASDTFKVNGTDNPSLTNIHTVMKRPSRRVYGKVAITYTDPLLNDEINDITTNSEAYNSASQQLVDGINAPEGLFFTLYDNNLTGAYVVSSTYSQVGWTSGVVSDVNGNFSVAPYVLLSFAARPLYNLSIILDSSHGCLAKDFAVEATSSSGEITTFTFVDNASTEVLVSSSVLPEVVSIKIIINKVSKGFSPVTILDIPVISTFLYVGYQDRSDLINMEVLEELTYEDDIEALGGVSANEVKVVLDNSSHTFNFNNEASPVARQLRRNRKIVPYLGAEVAPGEIEWHKLGIFWSYNWEVPYNSLIASVTGFDTIGLIDTTTFINHQTQVDKSIGYLIDYIMTDAKKTFGFLEWTVADGLYDVIIPYAWFDYGSHAAALRKISRAYPMHIYCDREGRICAAAQKLHLDYYYDKWSDDTNVIDKVYSSLYTVLPNIINVTVVSPVLTSDTNMVSDSLVFDVTSINSRALNFNNPYVSGLRIVVDKDASVQYTYAVYSWGIEFNFTGSGYVRSIECFGNTVDISNTSVVSYKDNDSITVNGAVTRDISADFIQTSSLASFLISRLNELSENDKYDVEVTYRGDIALTINDPILLVDGLAVNNRYNIKRQVLTWDGALSGTANLNT